MKVEAEVSNVRLQQAYGFLVSSRFVSLKILTKGSRSKCWEKPENFLSTAKCYSKLEAP